MMFLQSVAGQTFMLPSFGTNVTGYSVAQNGAVPSPGIGTVTNLTHAGSSYAALIVMDITEVAALGTVEVYALDFLNNVVNLGQANVVVGFPGPPVGTVIVDPSSRVAIAEDVWGTADLIELGLTAQNAMRCMFAVLCGKDVVVPLNAQFRNFGDTKTRVNVTLDISNQRVNVTYDFS